MLMKRHLTITGYATMTGYAGRLARPITMVTAIAALVVILLPLIGSIARAADKPVLQLRADDRNQLENLLGPGVIQQALPAGPLLPAADYLPKGHQLTFVVMEKGKKNHDEVHTIVPVKTGDSDETFQYDRSGQGRSSFVPA